MKQKLRVYWLIFQEDWRQGIGWQMLASFLTGILLAIFGGAIAANAWLPDDEGREWVTALAGWAGGTGAVLAAIIALPAIRAQVAEAKRQADFAIGDASPDIELVSASLADGYIRLHIVNWNRRPFLVTCVEIRPVYGVLYWHGGKVGTLGTPGIGGDVINSKSFENHKPFEPLRLYGWQDRNGPPSTCVALIRMEIRGPDKLPIICRIHGKLGGTPRTVEARFIVEKDVS